MLSNNDDLFDEIHEKYKGNVFDLNEIIEISGSELENEMYDFLGLDIFTINNISITIELFRFDKLFNEKDDIVSVSKKLISSRHYEE